MSRRTLCIVGLLIASLVTVARAEKPPNVVLIISDDQTYTDFGFMGNGDVLTPNLDRLTQQSARYVNGYVPSSVCRPSLVSILTGLYPHQHGIYFNHPPPGFGALTKSPAIGKAEFDTLRERAASLIRSQSTIPRRLAAAGYRCFQTGKYWEGHWRNAGFTEGMTTGASTRREEREQNAGQRRRRCSWKRGSRPEHRPGNHAANLRFHRRLQGHAVHGLVRAVSAAHAA